MNPADPGEEAGVVAAALLRASIDAVEPVAAAGRNSRVYRVRRGSESFALKHYPPRENDHRARLGAEIGALQLLKQYGIAAVPDVIGSDPAHGYAMFEWIEGSSVAAPGEADIDAALDFLAAVHRLRTTDAAGAQPLAAEACLSGAETAAQIERRIARLERLSSDEPELGRFIAGEIRPLCAEIAAWSQAAYAANGLAFGCPIAASSRTLCPSDFGFHNAMRTATGRLVFVDFDYFGWDDPAKLVADFLLHPGMSLPDSLKRRFAEGAIALYGSDPGFAARLRALFPLFSLRWCMILLNEFLPERWAHRQHAGAPLAMRESVKRTQLDKAHKWVQSLASDFRWFPYA